MSKEKLYDLGVDLSYYQTKSNQKLQRAIGVIWEV